MLLDEGDPTRRPECYTRRSWRMPPIDEHSRRAFEEAPFAIATICTCGWYTLIWETKEAAS